MPLPPHAIETWIFDLDNTLYPARSNLFAQISARMTDYIMRLLDLDAAAAHAEQKRLFRAHGTTMRGLMSEHGIDPHDFMTHVHDIDLSVIAADPVLDQALAGLAGRKLVFTNGSVRHAERVLARLGIERHFEGLFDIAASSFQPKPDLLGYQTLVERHHVDPRRAAMVEDMAVNLAPAAQLGMLTLLVRGSLEETSDAGDLAYVQHQTDDLAQWLIAHGHAPPLISSAAVSGAGPG